MKKRKVFSWLLITALLLTACKTLPQDSAEFLGTTESIIGCTIEPQQGEDYTVILEIPQGVYVNSVLYMPDEELSETANEENVGKFVGYVSYDNVSKTGISAFCYLPDDGKICRIIVDSGSGFAVYTFGAHMPDGTENWPAKLLKSVAYVEITGLNTQLKEPGENVVITDDRCVEQIVTFLSGLDEKHYETEINQRYYELFKECFPDGAIWINKEGRVVARDAELTIELSNMINKNDIDITLVLKDHTKLAYIYRSSASLVRCYDFAYYLSDEQKTQIEQVLDFE